MLIKDCKTLSKSVEEHPNCVDNFQRVSRSQFFKQNIYLYNIDLSSTIQPDFKFPFVSFDVFRESNISSLKLELQNFHNEIEYFI